MKAFLRNTAQALGVYDALGVAAARLKGMARGVRISSEGDDVYALRDHTGRTIFINRRHSIYLGDLVEYFDFYFDGATPNQKKEIHYEKPAWHTPPRWGRPLFFTSFAESEEVMDLYLAHGRVKPGDVVLDIGAYCGLTAFGFAEKVGDQGHVYAFEPDPENFAALQKNLEKYPTPTITIEEAAVWKETGVLMLQAEGTVASIVQEFAPRHHSSLSVRAVSLTEYISTKSIARLDLLKIDAEGAETDILASAREVLRKFRPRVILEVHVVHGQMTTDACRSLLQDEGYAVREVAQPGTSSPLLVADWPETAAA